MSTFSPHESLGFLVKRAQQTLRVALDAALSEAGLTTAQYAALATVEAEPGITNAALARRTFVTPQTMHGVVGGLEAAGQVEREPGAGRSVGIRLTNAGRSAVGAGHAAAAAVEERMTSGLDRAGVRAARSALAACCEALEGERGSGVA